MLKLKKWKRVNFMSKCYCNILLCLCLTFFRLEAAELKYINREPRVIDLERIADLEHVLRLADNRAEDLEDELNRMKLELSNRETSFNKIFNNTPIVGFINPIGTSGKVCFSLLFYKLLEKE